MYVGEINSDEAWEAWGKQDPYFGVITDPQFRKDNLDCSARLAFFDSGESHIQFLNNLVTHFLGCRLQPQRALDFGCGVGRVVIPLSRISAQVVGIDVSPSMLAEARKNCSAQGVKNASFVQSDDALNALDGTFDFVHSVLVFQHIPVERGRVIFKQLISRITPGGIGMIDFTYAKDRYADSFGVAPPRKSPSLIGETIKGITAIARGDDADSLRNGDPDMRMNSYNLSEIFFILQEVGISRVHTQFLDHGGERAAFLVFQKPA